MDQRLAIDGGAPTRTSPWPPWPSFAEDEVEAAAAVLRSGAVNYWTGPAGRRFEAEFADFVGAENAIALANGTIALELALSALGAGEGDDVIVPARTFVATAGAVATRGARPIVADVDPTSQNVTAESLDAAVTPTTKGVVVVHLAGNSNPHDSGRRIHRYNVEALRSIMDLADRRFLLEGGTVRSTD